jgi:zinc finger protein
MTIPEIDLELTHGTLGGRFTTVEGILDQVYEELSDKVFASGDSSIEGDKMKFEKFLSELKAVSDIIFLTIHLIHAQNLTRHSFLFFIY